MMNRRSVLAVALTLVVAFAAPVAAGSLALGSASASDSAQADSSLTALQQNNSSENDSISPGAKLAGVVSVQGAEVSGEVEQRAFGHRIVAAKSNASKASVIAEQSQYLEARLSEIQTKQQTLQAKYDNGTISTGQYKARMAKLAAEARTIQRLLDTTAEVASTVPPQVLESKGVSVDSITTLRANAGNLTGPEVAKIAIEIGGIRSGDGHPGLGNGSNGTLGVGDGNISVGTLGNVSIGNGNGTGSNPGNGSWVGDSNNSSGPGNPGFGNGTPGNGSWMPGIGNSTNVTLGVNISYPANGTSNITI